MSLELILERCQRHPDLLRLGFDKIAMYISLIRHLKPQIAFTQRSTVGTAPPGLPARLHQFLKQALGLQDTVARACWAGLRDIAWDNNDPAPRDLAALLPLFLEHGPATGVVVHVLFPPVRQCIVAECPRNPLQHCFGDDAPDLGEALTHEAVLFTHALGPVPVHMTSTYCRGCCTRYHPNFLVKGNVRDYYMDDLISEGGVIQISTHFFIEAALCERFILQMARAWTSAQNCARIYNDESQSYPWAIMLPPNWPVTYEIQPVTVSDAFVVYSLTDWHRKRRTSLEVPHKAPTQASRWHAAIQQRNLAMAGPGQPEWNHACDRCTVLVEDDVGAIVGAYRSVVTDGVALGHPCCGVHDCKGSLNSQCAVEKCHAPAEPSFRTCTQLDHRAVEMHLKERGKAMFQLKERLQKNIDKRMNNLSPVMEDDVLEGEEVETERDEDEVVVDACGDVVEECADRPLEGHRRVFARFGRRRTHNEELCVASCGIILGRATFYGAEGPNSVRVFWKRLFPTQSSLPSVMWYDNNCKLAAMLAKDGDTYFERVALPVDVFHFKSKHKESDGFCGQFCNPARWVELIDESTGRWRFNSSAAEQVNLWFGRFRSITRLMRADRFNFFLDEMIMRRNAMLVRQLEAEGAAPYSIPREELLCDAAATTPTL